MKVVFIDQTRRYKGRVEKYAWYVVGVLAVIAFGIFVYRPDLLLVP